MAMPLSSPDPLGMSNNDMSTQSPTKRGRHPLITPRKALTETSSNLQTREFYIKTPPNSTRNTSPGKSPRRITQSTSPWRIRLTVQAEPVDEIQGSNKSPIKRLAEQTTTFTVPLKGGDDTPPAVEKKVRGRPRKSLDGPVKRSGTPKPKPAGRRKIMSEPPKKQEADMYSETATSPKKPRGRPRKSMEPTGAENGSSLSQENRPNVWLGSSLVGGETTVETKPKTTRTKSKGRRQEITPMKIAVDSDIESQSSSVGVAGNTPKESAWATGNQPDESHPMDQKLTQTFDAPTSHKDQSFFSGAFCEQSNHAQQDESSWRSSIHRDTHSPSPHRDDSQYQRGCGPTVPHEEYDSILESEGFSMVSVSSLPSVHNNSLSPRQQYRSLHDHTPTITSSPSVPPAPQAAEDQISPRQLEIPSDGTPKLVKVVRAGIALQGVLSPKDQSQKLGSPFHESRKSSPLLTVESPAPQGEMSRIMATTKSSERRSGDLFRGFGAGTRRELKAGLRLGEELAKRQQRFLQDPVIGAKEGNEESHQTSNLNYPQLPASDSQETYSLRSPGSEQGVRYPLLSNYQLPSPERSVVDDKEERMSWKADTPIKQEQPALASAQLLVSDDSIGQNVSAIDYTMMARQEEWQREREAVSKQIEMANKSQVIIINSDDEEDIDQHDPEEDTANSNDIWQAEAQSADQSKETTPDVSGVLLQTEVVKPRRSKIPSPWRRNSQVIYSDELECTDSDLFWQPDQAQARAAKRRNARKGQDQDCSETSAESLANTSLENTNKAEAQIQMEATKTWPVEDSLLSNDEDSVTATSASMTSYNDSVQHTDQVTKPSAIVMPCKDHRGLGLSPSPGNASMNGVVDVAEKITTLKVTGNMSDEGISQISKDNKATIDPRLFQKKTRPSSASENPKRPSPIQPLPATQPSTSWLSRLTAPIWSVFAPAPSLQPAATKEDILCSSPHEPLCQLTPWEDCHFRALGPLYYGSLLYGAHLFPFNPHSPSARYCGAYVTTKMGWSRKIRPEDCGITDAFMILLDERGFALGEAEARWIDEGMVITKCVALWVGMVKRGEIEADRSKGERIGLRDQGDRKWTKGDIDWAGNQSEYFERKRREFDGLPSWKNKG